MASDGAMVWAVLYGHGAHRGLIGTVDDEAGARSIAEATVARWSDARWTEEERNVWQSDRGERLGALECRPRLKLEE